MPAVGVYGEVNWLVVVSVEKAEPQSVKMPIAVPIHPVPLPLSVEEAERASGVSVTTRFPVRMPTWSGVNVTLIVQLAADASVAGRVPQVSVSEKSFPFWPAKAIELTVALAVPGLDNVKAWIADGEPTCVEG